MKVVSEKRLDFVVLTAKGKITVGDGDAEIRQAIESAIQSSPRVIILDMERVTYVDSSGVGEMVSMFAWLREKGIGLAIVSVKPKVYGLLSLTRLVSVFPIYDSLEDAMLSLTMAA